MKRWYKAAMTGLLAVAIQSNGIAGGPEQPGVALGVYLGAGGSWATIDDSITWQTFSSGSRPIYYTVDGNFKDSQNRLAPWAQIGYAEMIDEVWLWGLAFQYKYLNYAQETLNGKDRIIYRTTANTKQYADLAVSFRNEMMLILYFGGVVDNQYFYLGIGSAMYTVRESVRHYLTDGFVSVGEVTNLWGGAFQLGYNYYFSPTWFIQFNYTYTVLVESQFYNQLNRAYFNTGTSAGAIDLNIGREYNATTQEVMMSINKVFTV